MKGRVDTLDKCIHILTARSKQDVHKILKLPHVKAIHLKLTGKGNRQLNDDDICNLLELSGCLLKSADLSGTSISGEVFTGSSIKLSMLESLSIHDCCELTDKGLCELLRMCGHAMKSLDLSSTTTTGESLIGITEQFEEIEMNDFAWSPITDKGLCEFLRICGQKLISLNLCGTSVKAEGLGEFTSSLSRLEVINMSSCCLTETGLCELLMACGNQLRSLDLSQNMFTGDDLHRCTNQLRNLEMLDLNGCNILTHSGLNHFLRIAGQQLKHLNLSFTSIREGIVGEPEKFIKLESLILICCQFSEIGLQEILGLSGLQLKNLSLCDAQMSEGFGGCVSKVSMLQHLKMSECRLTEAGLCEVFRSSGNHLKYVSLRDSNITGENLNGFSGQLKNLVKLDLSSSFCQLSDVGLCNLLLMCGPLLKHLDLSRTNLSGDSLSALTMPRFKLKNLNLKCCKNLTDSGLCKLLQLCGNYLSKMVLSNTHITGEGVAGVTKHLSLQVLRKLDLSKCEQLSSRGLCELLRISGNKLIRLDLNSNTLTGEGLAVLTMELPKLEYLSICSSKQLTDAGLCEFLRVCGINLKSLVMGSTNVTGEGLAGFTMKQSKLKSLHLGGCTKLTNRGLSELLRMCGPNLGSLHLPKSLMISTRQIPNCSIYTE